MINHLDKKKSEEKKFILYEAFSNNPSLWEVKVETQGGAEALTME